MISAAQVGWDSDKSVAIYPIAEALMETNIAVNKTLDIYCMALHSVLCHICLVQWEIRWRYHFLSIMSATNKQVLSVIVF